MSRREPDVVVSLDETLRLRARIVELEEKLAEVWKEAEASESHEIAALRARCAELERTIAVLDPTHAAANIAAAAARAQEESK